MLQASYARYEPGFLKIPIYKKKTFPFFNELAFSGIPNLIRCPDALGNSNHAGGDTTKRLCRLPGFYSLNHRQLPYLQHEPLFYLWDFKRY